MFRKLLSFVLTLMGFSAVFVFESCYGPIPANYNPDDTDSIYSTRCDTLEVPADEAEELMVPTQEDEQ